MPWSPERAAAAHAQFQRVAEAEGLEYGPRTHWYNSVPAHQAALWADQHGAGEEFRRAVYRAYFVDDLNIGAADVLATLAAAVGLDADDLRAALAEGRYAAEVDRQFQYAREMGITGVPAYVAGRYVMVGAQPYDVFCRLIDAAQAEEPDPSVGVPS